MMNDNIGFTGTRYGLTLEQTDALKFLLYNFRDDYNRANHGGCIEADEDFEEICDDLDIPITRWPACDVDPKWISTKTPLTDTLIMEPRPALERNRLIVINSHRIIACPRESRNLPRSGTWYTIRQAVNQGKMVYLIRPDGLIGLPQ